MRVAEGQAKEKKVRRREKGWVPRAHSLRGRTAEANTHDTPPPHDDPDGSRHTHETRRRNHAAGRLAAHRAQRGPLKETLASRAVCGGGARSGPVSSLEHTHRATVGTLARPLSVLPCWCARPVRLAARRLQRGGNVPDGLAAPPPFTSGTPWRPLREMFSCIEHNVTWPPYPVHTVPG